MRQNACDTFIENVARESDIRIIREVLREVEMTATAMTGKSCEEYRQRNAVEMAEFCGVLDNDPRISVSMKILKWRLDTKRLLDIGGFVLPNG